MIDGFQVYFDGWYALKADARACLRLVQRLGGLSVGIVESADHSWGLLYVSRRSLFENHELSDPGNPIWSPVRMLAS